MSTQDTAQDVLARIIAREQQRYEVIEKNIGVLSAEQDTLLKQGLIEDSFRLNVKIRKLLYKSLEIHRFICKLSAIAHGVSVAQTYDAFADEDDILIQESKKEAV
ncbi:hypothetical protein [Cloacibacillus sp. An23]|uniref:hypothetical protein n=1 Tax=Cloacibacillus sp. An23 TaxID=1965591 RepID=UPI000B37E5CC|nr:hypothetical protein [Cloacibacillus sp. An23]OUO91855.1 hypothetical protein B5F39_12025 [Cloacibacillus sp. An23]